MPPWSPPAPCAETATTPAASAAAVIVTRNAFLMMFLIGSLLLPGVDVRKRDRLSHSAG
jgi:hypothetical protein